MTVNTEISIDDLVEEQCDRYPSLDATVVAGRLLAELPPEKWRDLVLPWAVIAVEKHRRERVRREEEKAFRPRPRNGDDTFRPRPRNGDDTFRPRSRPQTGGDTPSFVARPAATPPNVVNGFDPDIRALRRLLNKEIPLGNATKVAWGKATVEELRTRREMLVAHRNGVNTTIARIDITLDLIEVTGAACLEEAIEKWEASE